MERESVLQWLQGVQTATHNLEEFDEGFINPDHISPQNPSVQRFTEQTDNYSHAPELPTSPRQFPTSSPPTSTSPASAKRAAFKLTKSNTFCGGDLIHMKQPYLTKKNAPSFDVPERDVKLRQSSISPLPSFNLDFELPTIHLTESELAIPERKPLLQQSNTAFLSKLKAKTPRQYQLLQTSRCRSVDLPECVKSAPCSPQWPRRAPVGNQGGLPSFTNWDMSQVGMEPVGDKILTPQVGGILEPVFPVVDILESVSQVGDSILEPAVKSAEQALSENADSAVASCIAEQGELSDVVSSGNMEEEGSEAAGNDRAGMKEESSGLEGSDMVWRREGEGNEVSTEYEKYPMGKPDQLKSNETVFTSGEPRFSAVQNTIPILRCSQQEAGEEMLCQPSPVLSQPSPLLSEPSFPVQPKPAEKWLAELLGLEASNPATMVPKRTITRVYSDGFPLAPSPGHDSRGPSPLTPSPGHPSPSPGHDSRGPSPLTPSPGHDSLAFHDHHLGRVPPGGLARSSTLDEGGGRVVAIGPTHGSKLHVHSPLLGRRGAEQDRGVQDLLFDRSGWGEKWKPSSVRVGWLSKPATTESLQ